MVKVGEFVKKILCLISIVIVIGVFLFLHHEQSLALEKKYNIDTINSNISRTYITFSNNLSDIKSNLIEMQVFFQSDPYHIPDIYDKYYSILSSFDEKILLLEKDGLKLQELCNDLDSNSNRICLVYSNDILEVKNNINNVIKKFNDTIIVYNDMSLSSYEVFR